MLKVVLISILFIYAVYRVSGFLMKVLSFGSNSSSDYRADKSGNIRVDKKSNNDKEPFDGGEYVDYEEVK